MRYVVIFLIITGLVASGGWYLYNHRDELAGGPASHFTTKAHREDQPAQDDVRQAILFYLAQPASTGSEFSAQILGRAHLELLDPTRRQAYLSLPREVVEKNEQSSVLKQFLLDDSAIHEATGEGGLLTLDSGRLRQTPEKWTLLKTMMSNFKINEAAVLAFPFKNASYTVSVHETMDFLRNRSVKGGLLNALTGKTVDGRPEVVANHAALVARSGEPSLKRFSQLLLQGIPNGEGARESRVQRLLDFVTTEVAYEKQPGLGTQFLKRPNEVLMTRTASCGNKVILFASLLEQIGEPYILVYMPSHLAVAVPPGRFKNENHLAVKWKGATWLMAETTTPHFRIGIDHLNDEESYRRLDYIQDPRNQDLFVELASGKTLSFQ